MSNFDTEGGAENQWEDCGDLIWNEFDWERYLREQDEAIQRYVRFYEACPSSPERIDQVAEKMKWGQETWSDDGAADETDAAADDDESGSDGEEVYTLHKNPIFITTKAIYLSLGRTWETLAADAGKIPQPAALALLSSLHRGEEQAIQAIHALDFGDYAMAVSLFKRALSGLNHSLALLGTEAMSRHRHVQAWRDEALSRLFDLREVWLRVIAECRDELAGPVEEDDDEG